MKQGYAIIKKVDGGFYVDEVDFSKYESYGYIRSFIPNYVEVYGLPDGFDIWVDEEGKINGEPPNVVIADEYDYIMEILHGNIVILSSDEEGNTLPLTERQVDKFFDHYLQGKLLITQYGFYETITLGNN